MSKKKFVLPKRRSATYWPVGTGDSSTLVLRTDEMVMQIDLNHLEKSEEDGETCWPIVDILRIILPKKNGKPYLAVFVMTHPDQDHIKGFAELLKHVHIGEIWHTPKIFRNQDDENKLCPDAKAFHKEVHRRRKAILDNPKNVKSGDRLRIIGHDDILKEDKYKDLPETAKSRPGDLVTLADGVEMKDEFEAFIHAPFSDDQDLDKNNTSLTLNVRLYDNGTYGQFFFFGDRTYPTIKKIFDITEAAKKNVVRLYYNVMLAAHHCSKGAMWWKDEGKEDETFHQDIMDLFEKYALQDAHIISSSYSDFTDRDGDLPPHKKARKKYEEVVEAGGFVCTHEYPDKDEPAPMVFVIEKDGVKLDDTRKKPKDASKVSSAAEKARGAAAPPVLSTTFGAKPK